MIERRQRAFTIIELLVVMAVIIVLAGLILGTSSYVQKKGARSRAEAEIAAMSAALESYKADNGIYPRNSDTDGLNAQTTTNPQSYQTASLYLYTALMADPDADGGTDGKSYMQLKPNQLTRSDMSNPPSAGNKVTGVRDPFGNYYGYSTMQASTGSGGYNPTFDLWSTAGSTVTNQWVKNW
ncbi:MAG: type II secretion system protein [Chthoniobacterales bacterium]